MDKKLSDEMRSELYNSLVSIQDPEEMKALLDDLCTIKELDNLAQRLYAAKLLLNGAKYHEAIEKTEISSATLSRVSKCVQYGKGYKLLKK